MTTTPMGPGMSNSTVLDSHSSQLFSLLPGLNVVRGVCAAARLAVMQVCFSVGGGVGCGDNLAPPRVMVFSGTAGYRHDAIGAMHVMFSELGSRGIAFSATEDAGMFSADSLASFDGVVFGLTSGDVLDDNQQLALQEFLLRGGGWVGLHSAADTEYGWQWYETLVGARFASHPPGFQTSTLAVAAVPCGGRPPEDLPQVTDELYNFVSNPRGRMHIVATLDESSYTGGTMGDDHPIAWCGAVGEGRSFYLGLGHRAEMYDDVRFRAWVLAAVTWSIGGE